jgi:hypothetical protein
VILYYAIGGGLGHVTRARRVLAALHLEATIATSIADAARIAAPFPVLTVPAALEGDPDAHRQWVAALPISRLIVDTFPCGLQGELAGVTAPADYVARLLCWDEYRRAVPGEPPRFETTFLVEPLRPGHDAFVRAWSDRVVELDLQVCAESAAPVTPTDDYWLIVHSGPADEVEELVEYTRELQRLANDNTPVLVASATRPRLPPHFRAIDAFPATPYFAAAKRIITAAGFNVMLETRPWRHKQHVVPFPRRFDDQFTRAARG